MESNRLDTSKYLPLGTIDIDVMTAMNDLCPILAVKTSHHKNQSLATGDLDQMRHVFLASFSL